MYLCEALESRQLMSTTLVAAPPEAAALLLPATQVACEAAETDSSATSVPATRPTSDVLYNAAHNSKGVMLQLVVM